MNKNYRLICLLAVLFIPLNTTKGMGLLSAVDQGNKQRVKFLLKFLRVKPNKRYGYDDLYGEWDKRGGETVLHRASRNGNKDIVKLLLAYGADVDAPALHYESDDRTPAYIALDNLSQEASKEIIVLLLAHGANINSPALLTLASSRGYKEVAELLLKHGANVNEEGHHGRTPLHGASLGGYSNLISLLLNNGASPCSRNFCRLTPEELVLCDRSKLRREWLLDCRNLTMEKKIDCLNAYDQHRQDLYIKNARRLCNGADNKGAIIYKNKRKGREKVSRLPVLPDELIEKIAKLSLESASDADDSQMGDDTLTEHSDYTDDEDSDE